MQPQDLQHGTMAGVLEQLQQWAAQSTRQQPCAPNSSSNSQQQPSCEPGLLPTVVLSLAASTNTAEAYAHLLVNMKQQVRKPCPTPHSSSSSRHLGLSCFTWAA